MAVQINLSEQLLEDGGEKYEVFFGKLNDIMTSAWQEHADEISHINKVKSILSQRAADSYDYPASDDLIDDDDDDEYLAYNQLEEEVYDHTLSTNYKVFCNSLYNTVIPRNTPVIDIERKGSRLLDDLGIPDFVADSNYAWVNIIDSVNKQHKVNAKYNKVIREASAYGRSGGYHIFRGDDLYVDIRLPSILNVKRTPLDAPKDSQIKIVKDFVDYSLLQADPEIDQELLSAIMPGDQLGYFTGNNRRTRTNADLLGYKFDTFSPETSASDYPFGTLPVYIVYIPYFYCYMNDEDEMGEPIELEYKKLQLTVVFNANFKPSADIETLNGGKPHVILKAKLLERHAECEITDCNFEEVLPDENYSRGLISDFVGDHNLLNTMRIGIAKIGDYISDPAWSAVKRDALGNSRLDIDRIESGAIYDQGFDFSALIHDNVDKQLYALKDIGSQVKGDIQDATAVNPTSAGNMPSKTAETAAAINTRMQRFDVRQEAPARQIDDEFIIDSHFTRITMTQSQLRQRIQQKLQDRLDTPDAPDQNAFEVFNEILEEDELFKRLMDFSGLEFAYREFYDSYNHKRSQEEGSVGEYEMMSQEYLTALAMAQKDVVAPIVPDKQTDELGNSFFVMNGNPVEWNDKNINRFLDEDLDRQMLEKDNYAVQAQELRAKMKEKEGTFEGLLPIPAPNNLLFFEILTDPIEDTDLTVVGSDTVLHRKEKIENSDRLAGMANARPEFDGEINWKGGLRDVARSMGLKIKTWFKTHKQKMRDEIVAREQQALMAQQEQQKGRK